VRASARGWLNGYLPPALLRGDLQQYIVAPALGERSGIMGALSLGQRLLA
jgi:fructokinase